jgi:N utilization substance protein B
VRIDRHQARILAMQALAQLDVQGDSFFATLDDFLAEAEVNDHTRAHAAELARECWAARAQVDKWIRAAAEHWSLERMSPVDRNTVRVAVREMVRGVPVWVAINEAIEISKEYGSAESARFVNGVLDAIRKRIPEGQG